MNDLANRILSSGGDYLNGIFCGFYFTLQRVFDLRSKTIGATEDGEPRIGLDLFGHNAVVCCFFSFPNPLLAIIRYPTTEIS